MLSNSLYNQSAGKIKKEIKAAGKRRIFISIPPKPGI